MKKLITVIIFSLLITGCNLQEDTPKYQLLNAGSEVYRLNTKTGEIVVFGHDGIQKYDDDYIKQGYQQKSSLNELKTDKTLTFPESNKQMWTTLEYKWRNDKILFQYSFGPYSEGIEKKFNNTSEAVTIIFVDEDGFEVTKQKINTNSLTRVVGDKGKIASWIKEGEVSCSKDDYKLVKAYKLLWSFDKELKDEIARHGKQIKKERQDNLAKVKKLVEEGKILGKIEGNTIFIKRKGGFKEIMEDDHDYVSYIVNNSEIMRYLQNKILAAEQDSAVDKSKSGSIEK